MKRLLASLVAAALAASCGELEPQVGAVLPACVDADSNPAVSVDFGRDIRPIMNGTVGHAEPCKNCHYENTGTEEGLLQSGLDLDTLGELRKGGVSSQNGTIAIPGKPCESVLVQKIRGTFTGPRMPKGGPYLTEDQILLFSDWIFEGAQGADSE